MSAAGKRARAEARGQAAIEYIVILALVTLVLVAIAAEPKAIDEVIAAVKSFFKAYSYALSIPAQDRF